MQGEKKTDQSKVMKSQCSGFFFFFFFWGGEGRPPGIEKAQSWKGAPLVIPGAFRRSCILGPLWRRRNREIVLGPLIFFFFAPDVAQL